MGSETLWFIVKRYAEETRRLNLDALAEPASAADLRQVQSDARRN